MRVPLTVEQPHDDLVHPLPVPRPGLTQDAFDHEADLLVDPPGAVVVAVDLQLDPVQAQLLEAVADDEAGGLRADAPVATPGAEEGAEGATAGAGIPVVEDDLAEEFAGGRVGDGEVEAVGVGGAGRVQGRSRSRVSSAGGSKAKRMISGSWINRQMPSASASVTGRRTVFSPVRTGLAERFIPGSSAADRRSASGSATGPANGSASGPPVSGPGPGPGARRCCGASRRSPRVRGPGATGGRCRRRPGASSGRPGGRRCAGRARRRVRRRRRR